MYQKLFRSVHVIQEIIGLRFLKHGVHEISVLQKRFHTAGRAPHTHRTCLTQSAVEVKSQTDQCHHYYQQYTPQSQHQN